MCGSCNNTSENERCCVYMCICVCVACACVNVCQGGCSFTVSVMPSETSLAFLLLLQSPRCLEATVSSLYSLEFTTYFSIF